MNVSSTLILPVIEPALVGALTGVVGILTMLGRQVFFAEAITHTTFPGVVIGVVTAATLGLSHSWISMFLFTGALLMCIPIGALFGLSKVGTTSLVARVVLAFGFALGCFLNKWFALLPVEIESLLTGSVFDVNRIDIALSGGLLLLVTVALAIRWWQLIYSAFDSEFFGVAYSRRKAQLVISGLIVLTLVALVPATGTILSITLSITPVTALIGVVNDTRLLSVLAPLMSIAIGLVRLFIAMAASLPVGGCIGVCAGCFYVPLKITVTYNSTRV